MPCRPRRTPARLVAVAAAAALVSAGCSAEEISRGWLPGDENVTSHTGTIIRLWTGSWIAALVVGVVVWGLILWCVVAYRRRRDDEALPDQLRYHVPLEVMYTVIPFMIVGVLFYYTSRDQSMIQSREEEPDVTIEAIGKQWGWDFNYLDEDVYESGIQVPTGTPDEDERLATLYLPVGQTVRMELRARDVIHAFWVLPFNYKQDMIPGRTNYYQFVPEVTGTYAGKCAEFCGEFHSEMLFNVAVVEQEEYDAQIEALRDRGQTGRLDVNLGRTDTQIGEQEEDRIGQDRGGQEENREDGENDEDGQG